MKNSFKKSISSLGLLFLVASISASCSLFKVDRLGPVGTVEDYDGYFKPSEYSVDNQKVNQSVLRNTLKTTGNQKTLVVPVKLSDGPSWTSGMLSKLNTAFFGASNEIAWESVSSFYKKSSYGKLNLSGEVYSVPLSVNATIRQANSFYDSGQGQFSDYVGNLFHKYCKENDPTILKKYDSDGDNLVDAICFVYSNNYGGDAFWAWTGWWNDIKGTNGIPGLNNYMWVSYEFMNDGKLGEVDAKTYIHEFGHILGLDDYYDYGGASKPLGGLDMMDHNIVDHNGFSKMLCEWSYPYIVDGTENETIVSIQPFESSGDCVIVGSSWNGSAFDEYLLLEYYTPTGLNKFHSIDGNTDSAGNSGFTIPGIKIHHIDARLARLRIDRNSDLVFDSYVTTVPNYTAYYYLPAASNSLRYSFASNPNYKLIRLLEATGVNSFMSNGMADNNTLFQEGDSFEASSVFFTNGKNFNNGKSVGYRIEIEDLSGAEAIIKFTKI